MTADAPAIRIAAVTKRYGRIFLDSLPPLTVVQGDRDTVFQHMEKFFQQPTED